MKVAIIGTGNMGSILLEAWREAGAVPEGSFYITNRTEAKAKALKARFPGIHTGSARVSAASADIIFLCVKPHDIPGVIQDIHPVLREEQCLVSITSPVSVSQLESAVPCACARLIPSITNRALAGVSLLTFGEHCPEEWQNKITELASAFSEPVRIENEVTRAASDIVSCGPAFFSYLARAFIDGAVRKTSIDEETAVILTENMLTGLGELLRKEIYTLPALQEKVCVKGGITGEGIKVLEEGTGDMFARLFQATQEKFKEDVEELEKQFNSRY